MHNLAIRILILESSADTSTQMCLHLSLNPERSNSCSQIEAAVKKPEL